MMLPNSIRESVTRTQSSTHLQHSKTLNPITPNMALCTKLPKLTNKMREALCLNESTAVYIIDRDDEIIIRPIHTKTPDAVKKISKMNLPVDDWETMEQEIESGAVNE